MADYGFCMKLVDIDILSFSSKVIRNIRSANKWFWYVLIDRNIAELRTMCYNQVFSISYNYGISLLNSVWCVCFSSEEIIYVGTQTEEFNRIDFYKSVNQYGLDSVIMIFT